MKIHMTMPRALLVLCAITSLVLPTVAEAEEGGATASALSGDDWLGRVNEIRQGSGLSEVTNNPTWEAGILAHLNYLTNTPSSYMTGEYASRHTENPASPYYTDAGAHEGIRSDLAGGTADNVGAINAWLEAPFHAIGMLRSNLEQVGFARDPNTREAGLDVISGLSFSEYTPRQVLFPGAGSTIDLARFGGESPTPIETCTAQHSADYGGAGLPLIAMLTETPDPQISASLSTPGGAHLSSSENDLCLVSQYNYVSTDSVYGAEGRDILEADRAVLLIPRLQLERGVYTVDLAQPGKPDITWSFDSQPAVVAPSLNVETLSCSWARGSSGAASLELSNYSEGREGVRYDLSVGADSGTATLTPRSRATFTYRDLRAGHQIATVTGSDGTSTSAEFTIPSCRPPAAARARFARRLRRLRRGIFAVLVLDNRLNVSPVKFTVYVGQRTSRYWVAGAHRRRVRIRLRHRVTLVRVKAGDMLVAKRRYRLRAYRARRHRHPGRPR